DTSIPSSLAKTKPERYGPYEKILWQDKDSTSFVVDGRSGVAAVRDSDARRSCSAARNADRRVGTASRDYRIQSGHPPDSLGQILPVSRTRVTAGNAAV